VGIDCEIHDDPQVYRDVVSFIRDDPNSLGGLVTTHKLDLLEAARDLFDHLDENAEMLGEISCISKRDGQLRGAAMDPITSGLALEAFVPREHWKQSPTDLCLIGAGGSSLALTMYVMTKMPAEARPARIVVSNRSSKRLESMKALHPRINPGIETEYVLAPKPEENDEVVGRLTEGAVVANATGLGKDVPGSPTTSNVSFPKNGYAWDFNYRGDLEFLKQARAQQEEKNLGVEDGWVYFIHGWTRVIAEVFDIDIPTSGPEFDELSRIAAEARKRKG
jgi:shikimate 5-dehydrogenase